MLWQLILYEIPSLGVVKYVGLFGNYVDMIQCYDYNRILTSVLREYQLTETYFSMCVRVL
jgi:hypothetical protein